MAVFGVWFKGRNTPAVVNSDSRSGAVSAAKRKGSTGSKGAVVAARKLKGASLRQARKGKWVRERANGGLTGGPFTFRPQLKK